MIAVTEVPRYDTIRICHYGGEFRLGDITKLLDSVWISLVVGLLSFWTNDKV